MKLRTCKYVTVTLWFYTIIMTGYMLASVQCVSYLQCVEVWQPDTVSPAQIPSKVVMADINGFQVPCLIPEEIQHINGLQENTNSPVTQLL